MATYKTDIFETLFKQRWDSTNRKLLSSDVTLRDISEQIQAYNKTSPRIISDRNPANFFKDYIRRTHLANKHWPQFIRDAEYTAEQVTGGGQAFRFVPLDPHSEPFPKLSLTIVDEPQTVQTLSLQPLARRLGRREETWLMQVVAQLRIVETHLAQFSSVKQSLEHVELLQLGIKQTLAEIDALYLGYDSRQRGVLFPVEAKVKDDIYPAQVYAQASALRSMKALQDKAHTIVPLAVKVIAKSTILVVEFPAIPFDGVGVSNRTPVSHSVYKLMPEVNGI